MERKPTREIPTRSDWQQQVVVTENRGGRQVLLAVRRLTCEQCGYGIRTETLWGTMLGDANRISWCATCFNAEFAFVELEDNQRHTCEDLVRQIGIAPGSKPWPCARPAIEDLESRGLL